MLQEQNRGLHHYMHTIAYLKIDIKTYFKCILNSAFEALEGDMCVVIKICLKRKDATRNRKENQPPNIKTAVEQLIFKI